MKISKFISVAELTKTLRYYLFVGVFSTMHGQSEDAQVYGQKVLQHEDRRWLQVSLLQVPEVPGGWHGLSRQDFNIKLNHTLTPCRRSTHF